MARNVYGLDLGSYDIKVYDKKKDTIWKEKNVHLKTIVTVIFLRLVMMHLVCMGKFPQTSRSHFR